MEQFPALAKRELTFRARNGAAFDRSSDQMQDHYWRPAPRRQFLSANSTAHSRSCSTTSRSIAVFTRARHLRACPRKIIGLFMMLLPKRNGARAEEYARYCACPARDLFPNQCLRRCHSLVAHASSSLSNRLVHALVPWIAGFLESRRRVPRPALRGDANAGPNPRKVLRRAEPHYWFPAYYRARMVGRFMAAIPFPQSSAPRYRAGSLGWLMNSNFSSIKKKRSFMRVNQCGQSNS